MGDIDEDFSGILSSRKTPKHSTYPQVKSVSELDEFEVLDKQLHSSFRSEDDDKQVKKKGFFPFRKAKKTETLSKLKKTKSRAKARTGYEDEEAETERLFSLSMSKKSKNQHKRPVGGKKPRKDTLEELEADGETGKGEDDFKGLNLTMPIPGKFGLGGKYDRAEVTSLSYFKLENEKSKQPTRGRVDLPSILQSTQLDTSALKQKGKSPRSEAIPSILLERGPTQTSGQSKTPRSELMPSILMERGPDPPSMKSKSSMSELMPFAPTERGDNLKNGKNKSPRSEAVPSILWERGPAKPPASKSNASTGMLEEVPRSEQEDIELILRGNYGNSATTDRRRKKKRKQKTGKTRIKRNRSKGTTQVEEDSPEQRELETLLNI